MSRLRTGRKLSQEKLAESCGISSRYVQMIEAGQRNATVRIAVKIKIALQCSWDELMAGLE